MDQIVEKIKKSGTFDKRTVNGRTILDDLEPVLHVHGTLSDALVLGLNDESQICNEQLKDDLTLHETIVKPKVNELLGESRTDKVKHFIDESRYVCVFGLSLGETDKIWWEYIGQWLQRDQIIDWCCLCLKRLQAGRLRCKKFFGKENGRSYS